MNQPIAREAGETSGEGKGHKAIEVKEQIVRNGADDPVDTGDDHGGARLNQLARNGADDPVDTGDDHGGARG